jgi:trimeric autotransporter adhesin
VGEIDTVAGSELSGHTGDGGPAVLATFNYPRCVAVDTLKNMYIADTENHCIRMVMKKTGIVTNVAGTGSVGSTGDGGQAVLATLNSPYGVAVDASGNVFIADTLNNLIRVVTKADGLINTAAGTGLYGDGSGDGGPATAAGLSNPYSIAFDTAGNLYIADTLNNRIRMVSTLTGIISTVVGIGSFGYSGDGGPAILAALSSPASVAVDVSGNIYIVDSGINNYRIRMVTKSTGVINSIAGTGSPGYSGDGGLATLAALNSPSSVAVDASGNVFIADTNNYRIRMVMKSSGIISTVAGTGLYGFSGDGGLAVSAMLSYPHGVAVDVSGSIYIADTFSHRIRFSKMPVAPTAAPTSFAMTPKPTVSATQGASLFAHLKSDVSVTTISHSDFYLADASVMCTLIVW